MGWLYHSTPATNLRRIQRYGIKRGGDKTGRFVYLSEKPYSWYRRGHVILAVREEELRPMTIRLKDEDTVLLLGDVPRRKLHVYKDRKGQIHKLTLGGKR